MSFADRDPFFGDVPGSVHLPKTPLTGVLVQMRFPEVLSISKPAFVADFQEAIRQAYPQHVKEDGFQLSFGPDGPQHSSIPTWRFLDAARKWRVTLTTDFLSLETRAYSSRDDFADRTSKLAAALQSAISPGYLTRLGVRYVDRIHGEQFANLKEFVRPEIMGIFNTTLQNRIDRTISEVHAETDCGKLSSRWGYMPANQTHEPSLMPAIAVPSWFLDIDTYQDFKEPIEFNPEDVRERTMQLATRSHGFFRWAVSDDFLRSYGGEL
ncbi:TIGR04255 family protein [Marinovum algicola]|uniref:TIGR04255 family protein n=1 Tax=Marinovum algicola TaxID=42444 RepID=UPI00352A78F1